MLISILRYLQFYSVADTKYQVHSPFVFDFALNVLEDDRDYYVFQSMEHLRSIVKKNSTKIRITDYSAGSKAGNHIEKTIGSIAKNAASKSWQCQTLFRLVNFYKPKTMLELGTSLGISTIYQASASMDAQFITLEGDPQVAKLANFHLEELNIKNVELRIGMFKDTIHSALNDLGKLDYVFLDGNHRLVPTLEYFEACLKYAHNETVFVFDDIHWSNEMEEAWEKLKIHPRVTISIDLFYMGIVFIRKENKVKEHYLLCPLSWKPWKSLKFF